MASAAISASSSGDNTVVAAVAGKKIRVHGYVLVCTTAVAAKWKSGASSDRTGAMPFGANGGVSVPVTPRDTGWFETAAGDALVLNLGSAVAVAGHLIYSQE